MGLDPAADVFVDVFMIKSSAIYEIYFNNTACITHFIFHNFKCFYVCRGVCSGGK